MNLAGSLFYCKTENDSGVNIVDRYAEFFRGSVRKSPLLLISHYSLLGSMGYLGFSLELRF